MKFQIRKIIIWPKNTNFAPRELEFELGKVNIITGASRTGKSAIIPIIDYCLASSNCEIPIDTIRDHAEWYGIIIQTDNEQLLIARKVPNGQNASKDFFINRGRLVSIPPIISTPNSRDIEIKLLLNKIITAPFFSLGSDIDNSFSARLSIRDLMALVFQSQEIVANQNILFYKTHSHEHREKLRTWFPYILGAETIEILKARHELKDIEFRLKRLQREFEEIQKITSDWVSNIYGLLIVANEYGLLNDNISEDMDSELLLQIAKSIIDDVPDSPESNLNNLESSDNELHEIERQDEEISETISYKQKKIK